MKLTEAEATLIHRLRAKEQSWRSNRWAVFVLSLLLFGCSILMFERIWSTVAPDEILIMLCIVVAPMCGIAVAGAIAGIVYALVFWRGCPARTLLLILADRPESQDK
jgi:hypothetical protein